MHVEQAEPGHVSAAQSSAHSAAPVASVALTAESLHQLLTKLKVKVDLEDLRVIGRSAGTQLQPIDFARLLLSQSQIKGAQLAQLAWRRLDLRRLPALVCHQDQWQVAERAEGDTIALTDAANTRIECDEAALQDAQVLWLRVAAPRAATSTSLFKDNKAAALVWHELFREPGWVLKVFMATVVINVLAIPSSIFAMQVYDRVVPTMAFATLTTMVAGMALITALDWLLKILRARILDSVSVTVDKRISQQLFEHLLHLRLDVQPKSLGTLAAQVSSLDSVRQFFSSGVIFGLIDLPFTLLFIAIIGAIGGKIAWVYALLLPASLVLGMITQLRLGDLVKGQMTRQNERQGVLVDTIRGAESIRANNASWRFAEEWRSITHAIDRYNVQQKALSNSSSVTTGSLSSVAYVAAIVTGIWQIHEGELTMGALVACSMLGGKVIAPLAQGVQYLVQWQGVSNALSMANQILTLALERRDNQHLLMPELPPESIAVEKLRFAYAESPVKQLHIPQLTFSKGDRILLIGPVGCGKSTLLKVLAGLYPPSEGRVRLGDADLWEIDPQVAGNHIGYLPQAVHLFKGTLRSNLALSGNNTDSRLLKITRDLGVDAIAANSTLGMDLPISEGGDGLSGGQRQLVSLARVVIAQPRIWLLDEPTASLDAESEARVWQALTENVRSDDILIVATHRPMAAAAIANRVILMRQGEVVRDDKPEVLFAQMATRPGAEKTTEKNAVAVNSVAVNAGPNLRAATPPATKNTGGRLDVI